MTPCPAQRRLAGVDDLEREVGQPLRTGPWPCHCHRPCHRQPVGRRPEPEGALHGDPEVQIDDRLRVDHGHGTQLNLSDRRHIFGSRPATLCPSWLDISKWILARGHDGRREVEGARNPRMSWHRRSDGIGPSRAGRHRTAQATFALRLIDTDEAAQAHRFAAPPLLDGTEAFDTGDDHGSMACRMYATPDRPRNLPAQRDLREALRQRDEAG